jgi:molybdate transport system substrate-binding protein
VLTVAAASDLRYALDELLQLLRRQQPGMPIEVVYGSSGKLSTQLLNGAPFDLFFSADRGFAKSLHEAGLSTQLPRVYAVGHLVAASRDAALAQLPLRDLLLHPGVKRFAIANPLHAPYGQRAREALQHQGLWARVEPRLVMGDNVTQAAQFIDTGAAQAGLVARSLVLAPALQGRLAWQDIPGAWHSPLEQAWVLMKRSSRAAQERAAQLLALMQSPDGQALMQRFGFASPGAAQR